MPPRIVLFSSPVALRVFRCANRSLHSVNAQRLSKCIEYVGKLAGVQHRRAIRLRSNGCRSVPVEHSDYDGVPEIFIISGGEIPIRIATPVTWPMISASLGNATERLLTGDRG